jgi:hypothetical protein
MFTSDSQRAHQRHMDRLRDDFWATHAAVQPAAAGDAKAARQRELDAYGRLMAATAILESGKSPDMA